MSDLKDAAVGPNLDEAYVTEIDVRIVVKHQFPGNKQAKDLIESSLDFPAVIELDFSDSITWLPGIYKRK